MRPWSISCRSSFFLPVNIPCRRYNASHCTSNNDLKSNNIEFVVEIKDNEATIKQCSPSDRCPSHRARRLQLWCGSVSAQCENLHPHLRIRCHRRPCGTHRSRTRAHLTRNRNESAEFNNILIDTNLFVTPPCHHEDESVAG